MPEPVSFAPFEEWTYDDAVVAARDALRDDYTTNRRYVIEKDHFNRGLEWTGPGDAVVNTKIKNQFAPDDAVGSVVDNVTNAFVEPQIGVAPLDELPEGAQVPEELQKRMDEASALLSSWWDRNDLQEKIQEILSYGVWAGHGAMRLWIPGRFLIREDDGTVRIRNVTDPKEASKFVYAMTAEPDCCLVLKDADTQDTIGLFFSTKVVYRNGSKYPHKRVEMVYLDPKRETDDDAETIIRVVYADDEFPEQRSRLRLNGRHTISETKSKVLVTDPVIRSQRQLNFISSLLGRMTETAAFRERYFTNAKPQGIRYPYSEGDSMRDGAFLETDDQGRLWQVVPQPRTLGSATATELVGLPKQDPSGTTHTGYHDPKVVIADPVDPRPYIEAANQVRARILRMCAQGHLAGTSNMEVSGIAYEQARAVFEKDLNKRRVPEEAMLRHVLTCVLAFSETIAKKPGYFTKSLRVTVDQRVDAGPRSPDLVRLELEANEAGVLSDVSTMSRMGVEDPEAEDARVRNSATRILDVLEKATVLSTSFELEGVQNILRRLGIPEDIVKELAKTEPATPLVGTEGDKVAEDGE